MNATVQTMQDREAKTIFTAANLLAALLLLVAFTMTTSSASAQYYVGTAHSSWLHGHADVIRARGEYNLRTAQAATELEQARSANMRNRLQSVETYFEGRRMNRVYREAERKPRLSREQLYKISKKRAPKRLNESQFDRSTSQVFWPAALQNDRYATNRQVIERLLKSSPSANGYLTAAQVHQINVAADRMLATLNQNIRGLSANEWSQSKKFLQSLKHEVSFMAS